MYGNYLSCQAYFNESKKLRSLKRRKSVPFLNMGRQAYYKKDVRIVWKTRAHKKSQASNPRVEHVSRM